MRPPAQRRSPWQFNLFSLFVLTTVVAVVTWMAVTFGFDDFLLIWFFPSTPIFALTAGVLGIIYRQGKQRAFWIGFTIGAVQSMTIGVFLAPPMRIFREWEGLMIVPYYCFVVPLLCGWLGKYFYWLGEQANANAESDGAATPAPASPDAHAHPLDDDADPGTGM